MDSGVSMQMPGKHIGGPGRGLVGADTTLEPNVQLLGKTCGVGSKLHDSHWQSLLSGATLEDGVLVKPYSIISEKSSGCRRGSGSVRCICATVRGC